MMTTMYTASSSEKQCHSECETSDDWLSPLRSRALLSASFFIFTVVSWGRLVGLNGAEACTAKAQARPLTGPFEERTER